MTKRIIFKEYHYWIHILYIIVIYSTRTVVSLNGSQFGSSGPPLTFHLPLLPDFNPHSGNTGSSSDDKITDVVEEPEVDLEKLGGIDIRNEAEVFGQKLRQITNEELKVVTMQGIYDSCSYKEVQIDHSKELDEILSTTRMTADNLYQLHFTHPLTLPHPCCSIANNELKYDDKYEMSVSYEDSCDLIPQSLTAFSQQMSFNPGRNLTEVFQHNIQYLSTIRWQYFISTQGIQNSFPAQNFNKLTFSDCLNQHNYRHQGVLLSTMYPWSKNVVVVIDTGSSLSKKHRELSRSLAKYIIHTLAVTDRVGVISVSGTVRYPHDGLCDEMRTLSREYRTQLSAFIDSLDKQTEATNHTLALTSAYEMIRKSFTGSENAEVLIMYLSRGLLSSLTEARDVMYEIRRESNLTSHNVFINTYALIDESKPVMLEKTFLSDIATQNFSKYFTDISELVRPRIGQMNTVSSVGEFSNLMLNMFKPFNWTMNSKPVVHLPRRDVLHQGLVIPVSWPCMYQKRLFGMVGFDVPIRDIIESVVYGRVEGGYAFLIDCAGNIIYHPSLSSDGDMVMPADTDATVFENSHDFVTIRNKILKTREGEANTYINPVSSNVNSTISAAHQNVTYMWRHVVLNQTNSCSFIVVIRYKQQQTAWRHLTATPSASSSQQNVVYHRLDLIPSEYNCLHFSQLSTSDGSAVFLSASSFNQSYEHLTHKETKKMIQTFITYLRDSTDLISNPGILPYVRDEVVVTQLINEEWKKQMKDSVNSKYISRRYVATVNGMMRMYPGTLINKQADFTKRQWLALILINPFSTNGRILIQYRRAVDHPGRMILTSPHLDSGGAGYIITVSHTIYEGRMISGTSLLMEIDNDRLYSYAGVMKSQLSLHSASDPVVAVMGADFTMKYFYKLLTDQLPTCHQPNIRCFIMDERGYLIAHEGLIEPNSNKPREQNHISHREPLLMNDILNHRGFVEKRSCTSFTDRTVQRFYQFNISSDHVVRNLIHGEHCVKYQVTSIPGSNVFLGIVNETCDVMRAFCPCSTVDRLCLNCVRMEQTECECPCECPLHMDICSNDPNQLTIMSVCQRLEGSVGVVKLSEELSKTLSQCFQYNCSSRLTKSSCIGVLDCEWCEVDRGGGVLSRPYCSNQRVCFGGMVGAVSPYNNHISFTSSLVVDSDSFKSIPIGPIAGGIMGCLLLFALGIYCYRHQAARYSRYSDSLPDGQTGRLRDSGDLEELDDNNGGHTNIVLSTFENTANINPYFVNTSYRRPTVADSDLGYSSMTTGGDCELASSSCVESVVASRDPASNTLPSGRGAAGSKSNSDVLVSDSDTDIITELPKVGDIRRNSGNYLSEKQRLVNTVPVYGNTDLKRDGITVLPNRQKYGVVGSSDVVPCETVSGELRALLPHQVLARVQVHSTEAC